MRRPVLIAALVLAPAVAWAQQTSPFPGMAPPRPVKQVSFQAFGGVLFPLNYNYYTAVSTDDVGWTAGGTIVFRPRSMMHVRVEGEYLTVGTSGASSAAVYGGGIGGGRALTQGTSTTEGYFLAGLYNVEACIGNLTGGCTEASELQFGTKLGANFVVGRGKVQPALGFGWLYTWASPYVSAITITGGLRF